ncbi:hypothetical protein [Borrelia hermsii]|uniref:hypothetical protein n=1 Tax=Borrelia hermsii TaxID=140 RepID=UPI00046D5178|nr:hypothetical protein [Borrelia hermsii]
MSRKIYKELIFKKIAYDIKDYNNNIELLDGDEKDALNFLKKAIIIANPKDGMYDHEYKIQAQSQLTQFMLDKNIDTIKRVLQEIMLALNAKKAAEEALANYTGPDKDTFTQRLKIETSVFKYFLKILFAVNSSDTIYDNLLLFTKKEDSLTETATNIKLQIHKTMGKTNP